MVNWRFSALFALLDVTFATTAPGFPIQGVALDLSITFGANIVSPPGELIPRPGCMDTANAPNSTTPVWTSANKAVLMMVDIDVPRNNTRVQLLHWLVSNVTLSSSFPSGNNSSSNNNNNNNNNNNASLAVPPTAEAPYRQPSPPVGDSPHAYTVLLFAQPTNFSVPAQFQDVLQSRIFFDTSAFVAAAGLQSPLAANYFRVQNLTGSATQSFPPPRSTATEGASTSVSASGTGVPEAFPGGAAAVGGGFGGRMAWGGVASAVLAGFMAVAL